MAENEPGGLQQRVADEGADRPLEPRLKERIIGQESAISTVAKAIQRKQSGSANTGNPLVLLLLGPTGVGKTELAKQVAYCIHGSNQAGLVTLYMHDCRYAHSISKLVGSPTGYVGHNGGGQLTEALKLCNNAVVLLEGIEFAHRAVLSVLLQMFDGHRLTDCRGQTIDCNRVTFIMTSNLAGDIIANHCNQLVAIHEKSSEARQKTDTNASMHELALSDEFKRTHVEPILRRHFCGESARFFDRIDKIVYLLPFTETETRLIVVKELEFWKARAECKFRIELTWDREVIGAIQMGSCPEYGARSIKHEVEQRLIGEIAAKLSEEHDYTRNAKRVHISVKDCKDDDGCSLFDFKFSK